MEQLLHFMNTVSQMSIPEYVGEGDFRFSLSSEFTVDDFPRLPRYFTTKELDIDPEQLLNEYRELMSTDAEEVLITGHGSGENEGFIIEPPLTPLGKLFLQAILIQGEKYSMQPTLS